MAIKHNQQIQKNHFRKDWQRRVRVHFDQPGRKSRRRDARKTRAAALAPRPLDRLRPIVRCPTVKYNRRVRAGRGFSLAELKLAGIPRKLAPSLGIAVDPRRQNLSEEALDLNVDRLKQYRKQFMFLPKRPGKVEKGPSAEDVKKAKSQEDRVLRGHILPIHHDAAVKEAKLKDVESTENPYATLRRARADKRYAGVREKRAKAKAEEAETKKK